MAEDLFQETWLRLARNAPRLREDTDLRAWLFTVARNLWVSHCRCAPRVLGHAAADAVEKLVSPESAADDQVEVATRLARLESVLASLPGASREVLLLVGVEGFEQEEAARILGISYDALRQRLARARMQLAHALERTDSKEAIA